MHRIIGLQRPHHYCSKVRNHLGHNAASQGKAPRCMHRTLASATNGQNRVGLAVFRQLLRWCRNTPSDIPLRSLVPPSTIIPPFVDQRALERRSNNDLVFLRHLLPENSILRDNEMTVPVRNSTDIANLLRVIHRINRAAVAQEEETTAFDQETIQQRIKMGFDALKSMNKLSGEIETMQRARSEHLHRSGVDFCIGQVVQHRTERWRGIVIGWKRIVPTGKLTSLTTKVYTSGEESTLGERILYTVLPEVNNDDVDDVQQEVFQTNLNMVVDEQLCRIVNTESETYFEEFDVTSNTFKPNESLQYEYPLDQIATTEKKDDDPTETLDQICEDIIHAIVKFAARFEHKIMTESPSNECSQAILQHELKQNLDKIISGLDYTDEDRLMKKPSPVLRAQRLLQEYHLFVVGLSECIKKRRIAIKDAKYMKFQLGDVVEVVSLGVRGIIIGWAKPLYGVEVPKDRQDTEKPSATRIGRRLIYLDEENLQKCPVDRQQISVTMNFFGGASGNDHESTEHYCLKLYEELNAINLVQRGLMNAVEDEVQQIGTALSTKNLFQCLKFAKDAEFAMVIADVLCFSWNAHPDFTLRLLLDDGKFAAELRRHDEAVDICERLKSADPSYEEPFTLLAACLQLMQQEVQQPAFVARAFDTALMHNPDDFRAMQWWCESQMIMGHYEVAALKLRECLRLHPWMDVSRLLVKVLDLIEQQDVGKT